MPLLENIMTILVYIFLAAAVLDVIGMELDIRSSGKPKIPDIDYKKAIKDYKERSGY